MTSAHSFPASLNFRDLGPVTLGTGLTLATGRFYRSGDPSRLGAEGAVALARATGIRDVIDVRTTVELRQRAAAPILPSASHLHHPLFEAALPHWIGPTDQT